MNIRRLMILLFAILLGSLSFPVSTADLDVSGNTSHTTLSSSATTEPGTVHDLITFVQDAVVFAQRQGKERALQEFADKNGSFTRGDRYIWAYDINGTNLAHPWHPEYTGVNKLDLTDSSGFHMIAAMRDLALNGSGYVRYTFDNPVSGKTESKLAYVKRVDDSWWLASGIYGEGLIVPSDAPESVQATLKDQVQTAVRYVREVGEEKALAAFNNPDGPFVTNTTYIFAFDLNGTTRAMPFRPELVGVREENLTDINGVQIGREKLRVASEGGGFYYYVYDDPKANHTPPAEDRK